MTNNTLCRFCFQIHPFLAKKAPGDPFLAIALFYSKEGFELDLNLFQFNSNLQPLGSISRNPKLKKRV